jgi:hypothetical protein
MPQVPESMPESFSEYAEAADHFSSMAPISRAKAYAMMLAAMRPDLWERIEDDPLNPENLPATDMPEFAEFWAWVIENW